MNWIEVAAILMFFIAFFGLITDRKIIKSIIYIILLQTAVIVFFLSMHFRPGATPPIGETFVQLEYTADPFPQALMITSIIIGMAVVAINITMLMFLFRKHKLADWETARQITME